MAISVGTLRRSVITLSQQLKKQGYQCQVDQCLSGSGSSTHSGYPSNVTLTVNKNSVNTRLRFLANGRIAKSKDEIGALSMKWSEMKQIALKRLAIAEQQAA